MRVQVLVFVTKTMITKSNQNAEVGGAQWFLTYKTSKTYEVAYGLNETEQFITTEIQENKLLQNVV